MSVVPPPGKLLPDHANLYSRLVAELEFLKSQPGSFSRNKDRIERCLSELRNGEEDNWTLNIDPNWTVRIKVPELIARSNQSRDFAIKDGLAVIGGLIDVSGGEFTEYSLNLAFLAEQDSENRGQDINAPCCWRGHHDDQWRVAKRYHFDVDPGNEGDENKPITHLQSRGEFDVDHLPSHLIKQGVHYCATPLDKPRLPYPPMDPVLLLQMVLDQYNCPKQLETEHWTSEVMTSEEELWSRYYNRISEQFSSSDRSESFDTLLSNEDPESLRQS